MATLSVPLAVSASFFKLISKRPNVAQLLFNSLAPSIHGMDHVKTVTLLDLTQLFNSVSLLWCIQASH